MGLREKKNFFPKTQFLEKKMQFLIKIFEKKNVSWKNRKLRLRFLKIESYFFRSIIDAYGCFNNFWLRLISESTISGRAFGRPENASSKIRCSQKLSKPYIMLTTMHMGVLDGTMSLGLGLNGSNSECSTFIWFNMASGTLWCSLTLDEAVQSDGVSS